MSKQTASLKLALLALGGLILLLVLGKAITFLTSLNKPYTTGLTSPKQYAWDGESSFNLLYANFNGENKLKDISFINFQPRQKEITVLHVPDSVYTTLPKGYGSWTVGSIYPLGQEDTGKGAQLLRLSLNRLLGLPIDGLILRHDSDETAEALLESIRKNSFRPLWIASSLKSDLTTIELMKVSNFISGVRSDKMNTLDLAQSAITESKLLPDSSRVLGVNNVRLDSFIRENLSDTSIVDENVSIAIYNATKHPGLAQDAARMVTNLGGTVVATGNTESYQDKSSVILKNEEDPVAVQVTMNRLNEMFAPHCKSTHCTSSDQKVLTSRASLVVVLGDDFYNYWNQR